VALAWGARAPVQGDAQNGSTHDAEGLGLHGAAPAAHPFAGEALVMVAADTSHLCALTETGVVWVWGRNDFGHLGTRDDTDVNDPKYWYIKSCGTPFVMVVCVDRQTVCLLQYGRVYACGQGGSGQNGDAKGNDRHRIRRVRGLQDIVMVAAGLGYSAALDSVGADETAPVAPGVLLLFQLLLRLSLIQVIRFNAVP